MPPGAFTSSIDVQDATNKAKAEAQRLANLNGECATVYVKVVIVPNSNGGDNTQLNDVNFYFYSDAAGTVPLSLPNGITINYKWNEWWTNNGNNTEVLVYDDGYTVSCSAGSSGVLNDFETSYCPVSTSCRHQEFIIKPGAYVIIP
jgi:hypothetical protein